MTEPDQSSTPSSTTSPTFEERIETYLDSGDYDAAVMAAYTAVHDELAVENGIDEGMTHWELLRQSRADGVSDERTADIETVVKAFETAASRYASSVVSIGDCVSAGFTAPVIVPV